MPTTAVSPSARASIGCHPIEWSAAPLINNTCAGFNRDYLRFLGRCNLWENTMAPAPTLHLNCLEFVVVRMIYQHLQRHHPNHGNPFARCINYGIRQCRLVCQLDLTKVGVSIGDSFERAMLTHMPEIEDELTYEEPPYAPRTWGASPLRHNLRKNDMLVFTKRSPVVASYVHVVCINEVATHVKDLKVTSLAGHLRLPNRVRATIFYENAPLHEVFRTSVPSNISPLALDAICLDPEEIDDRCDYYTQHPHALT